MKKGKMIKNIVAGVLVFVGAASAVFSAVLMGNAKETVLSITVKEENLRDIYTPPASGDGYRYGPSIIKNENGEYEALFSTNPSAYRYTVPDIGPSCADVFTYRTSNDGGMTWSDEVLALIPEEPSMDRFSVCDPGWLKVGEWYYVAYTSTFDATAAGVYNHIYAARTKTPTDYKSWEKWNGNGWSAYGTYDYKPIIEYYGSAQYYGIGEPSMVVVDGKLFVYYSYVGTLPNGTEYVNQSRVAVGRMDDEMWPATLQDVGPVIANRDGSEDAIDVKYIDELGLFLSLNTYSRFSRSARLKFMTSEDGIYFKEVQVDSDACIERLHNAGMAGDYLGHISLNDPLFVSYAYARTGKDWGKWCTAVQYFDIEVKEIHNKNKLFESAEKDAPIASNVDIWALSDIGEYDKEVEGWYSADKAADGNVSTYYYSYIHPVATYNEVLAFRTGGSAQGVKVTPTEGGECFPAKFHFEYSDDGTHWFDIEGASYDYSASKVTSSDELTFAFNQTVKAKFIRLVATELTDYVGLYAMQIAEISAY